MMRRSVSMTNVTRLLNGTIARVDAELLGDSAVGIRQQREVERVLLAEFALTIHLVGTDTDALRARVRELRREVAEVAALLRATARQRLRVEEEDDGPLLQRVGELERAAVVGRELEVGCDVAGFHLADATSVRRDASRTAPDQRMGRWF